MSDDVTQAHEGVRAAESAYRAIERRRDQEVAEAKAAIHKRYEAEIATSLEVVKSARTALRDAMEALPEHAWAGKRVFKMKKVGRFYERRPDQLLKGVVETRRSNTPFPANKRYGIPEIGQPFVRLLKADGTTGLAFDTMYGWALVEDGQ